MFTSASSDFSPETHGKVPYSDSKMIVLFEQRVESYSASSSTIYWEVVPYAQSLQALCDALHSFFFHPNRGDGHVDIHAY